ncbi:MAG: OmpH family outer membrane protein [Kiritimatiellae bacterium]|nr:OmpH family outer membrane protein [Kiritimatiellia bacterium]MDW8457630.1 OmpH family outer membrane protein [Verrucomicrobiota bacterium]
MTRTLHLPLVVAAAALFAAAPRYPAAAQGEAGRIVFVDMNKVFDEYYKTKLAEGQLKEQESELKEELRKMVDRFKELQESFRQAREESEDTALSDEVRTARRTEAEEKLIEMREMESRIRRFEESRRRQMAEQLKRIRDKLVVEIRDALKSHAEREGYLAVLEISGDNLNGVPNVLFYDREFDITQELIDILNSEKK